MKIRTLAATAAIAALALTTAACSGNSNPSSSSSAGSDASGAGGTITYWASNQGTSLDNDKQVLSPELDEVHQADRDQGQAGGDRLARPAQTRIQTAVTDAAGADVLNIGNTWAASLQATGAFMPFDDAAMKAIGGKDKFVKTALDTGGAPARTRRRFRVYGLAYGLYYNKAMFAAAGCTPPTTGRSW